jgi:hypothetical protein
MLDLDVRIDTELLERAVAEVDGFVNKHGTPVTRTQIAGLQQIAVNEPDKIANFASKQKERAEKRLQGIKESDPKYQKFQSEIVFWAMVSNLCSGKGAQVSWSLLKLREQEMPADYRLDKPHPSAPAEERNRFHQIQSQKAQWERRWNRDHFPAFFRHFCAHYKYRKPAKED